VSRDDIRVAPHDDCYEVLVPLRGQARAVAAERATHLRSARAPKTFGELLGEGAVNADEQDVSAAALGGALPDVLVVNSAHYHGFAALKQADAWAFHVRCYDFKPGRRPGGIESDVQATGVARQGLHSGHRHSRGR
jgi:hypothetical protein